MEDGKVGSSRVSPSTKTTIKLVRTIRINYFRMLVSSAWQRRRLVNFKITHCSQNPLAPLKWTMGIMVRSWCSFLASEWTIRTFSSKNQLCISIYLKVHWKASTEAGHWFNPKMLEVDSLVLLKKVIESEYSLKKLFCLILDPGIWENPCQVTGWHRNKT